jgi:hypothetical protein
MEMKKSIFGKATALGKAPDNGDVLSQEIAILFHICFVIQRQERKEKLEFFVRVKVLKALWDWWIKLQQESGRWRVRDVHRLDIVLGDGWSTVWGNTWGSIDRPKSNRSNRCSMVTNGKSAKESIKVQRYNI